MSISDFSNDEEFAKYTISPIKQDPLTYFENRLINQQQAAFAVSSRQDEQRP